VPQSYIRDQIVYDTTMTPEGVSYGVARTASRDQRQFAGSRTPHHQAFRKTNGYLPTTDCSDVKVQWNCSPVTQTIHDPGPPYGWSSMTIAMGGGFAPPDINMAAPGSGTPFDSIGEVAMSKLRAKMLGQDTNAAITVSELDKTGKMILKTATTIFKAVKALKKGDLVEVSHLIGATVKPSNCKWKAQNAPFTVFENGGSSDFITKKVMSNVDWTRVSRRQLKEKVKNPLPGIELDVHNSWLSVKYGWMPLLKDIDDSMKALANINVEKVKRPYLRVNANEVLEMYVDPKNSDPRYQKDNLRGTITCQYKCWCIYTVNNTSIDLANRLGFLNPLSIAWEVLPLSFMFDWFSNVGSALSELTAFIGKDILDAGRSLKFVFQGECINKPFDAPFNGQTEVNATVRTTTYYRVKGIPALPSIRFKLPNVANWQGGVKLLTSLALLKQRM